MDTNNNVRRGIAGFIILVVRFKSETLASPYAAGADLSPKPRLAETYGELLLSFEENRGRAMAR